MLIDTKPIHYSNDYGSDYESDTETSPIKSLISKPLKNKSLTRLIWKFTEKDLLNKIRDIASSPATDMSNKNVRYIFMGLPIT